MRDKDKDTDKEERKPKKPVIRNFSRCKQPMCAEKITVTDEQDPDLQIAKHNKAKHDIPFPSWVDIVWDKLERKKPHKARY